jgi:hypothetical protein
MPQFTAIISKRQLGEEIKVEFIRGSAALSASVKLKGYVSLVPAPDPRRRPEYVIWAGFVFGPLTYEYIAMAGHGNAFYRFLYYFYDRFPSERQTEVVIISHVLEHEVNRPYHDLAGAIISKVNGHAISSLRDLASTLRENTREYQVVEFDNYRDRSESKAYDLPSGDMIVIESRRAEAATLEVLSELHIAR